MNTYQAVRDAMRSVQLAFCSAYVLIAMLVSIAMTKDDTAIVFGEDVAFGGVFRCTMVNMLYANWVGSINNS